MSCVLCLLFRHFEITLILHKRVTRQNGTCACVCVTLRNGLVKRVFTFRPLMRDFWLNVKQRALCRALFDLDQKIRPKMGFATRARTRTHV